MLAESLSSKRGHVPYLRADTEVDVKREGKKHMYVTSVPGTWYVCKIVCKIVKGL